MAIQTFTSGKRNDLEDPGIVERNRPGLLGPHKR